MPFRIVALEARILLQYYVFFICNKLAFHELVYFFNDVLEIFTSKTNILIIMNENKTEKFTPTNN